MASGGGEGNQICTWILANIGYTLGGGGGEYSLFIQVTGGADTHGGGRSSDAFVGLLS